MAGAGWLPRRAARRTWALALLAIAAIIYLLVAIPPSPPAAAPAAPAAAAQVQPRRNPPVGSRPGRYHGELGLRADGTPVMAPVPYVRAPGENLEAELKEHGFHLRVTSGTEPRKFILEQR